MMKLKITRSDILLFTIQVAAWAVVLLLPVLSFLFFTQKWGNAVATFWILFGLLRAPLLLWFVNFYLLEPLLWSKGRRWQFIAGNVLLILLTNYWIFIIDFSKFPMQNDFEYIAYSMGMFIYLLFCIATVATTVGLRNYMRSRRLKEMLKEEQQKHTEAELAWLKNQINPHFLFNTLNNISSLIQIDPDTAQDSIAQLSDLLRYAMYETDKQLVPLKGEIDFMQNYIDLMRLRHNEKLTVCTKWSEVPPQTSIPPLLFISLIENAFKHGVSSSRPSSIDISLFMDNGQQTLTFTCSNTNYPKNDQNRSGSGIGIENTRRRLDLMYPGRYTWEQTLGEDNIYTTRVTLKIE